MAHSVFSPTEFSRHCTKQTISCLNIYLFSFSPQNKIDLQLKVISKVLESTGSQDLAACFPEGQHLDLYQTLHSTTFYVKEYTKNWT